MTNNDLNMKNHNFDILKKNIRELMNKKGWSQTELSQKIGMEQSNVSKCLSSGRCFTLEQVCRLSDLFDVSIDELLGRKKNYAQTASSIEIYNFIEFLAALIESGVVISFPHTIEQEEVWDRSDVNPVEIEHYKRKKNYYAFYFPDFIPIPPCSSYDEANSYEKEYEEYGNYDINNIQVNKCLNEFVPAYIKLRTGDYTKNVYKIVTAAYLGQLKETMEKFHSHSKSNSEADN